MSISFHIEAWSALAPGLDRKEDWLAWLQGNAISADTILEANLSHIPVMLRRRFNTLGKCAMGAISGLLQEDQKIPSIFASRHGDTGLTLSLLETMGKDEPMSPTAFSLAVHNAVSGLYSIARKDTSAVTAIAAMEGLTISALCEAIGQLQEHEKVLCVVYDVPLPALYSVYCEVEDFPYAIAMILSRDKGQGYELCQNVQTERKGGNNQELNDELGHFIALLMGVSEVFQSQFNGCTWQLKNVSNHAR